MTVARPANWRKRWDAAAEEELRARLARREPLSMIAAAMGRTNHAIRGRAGVLHLVVPHTARPWRESVRRG